MKQLIHIDDYRSQLHCDNPACGYDLPEGSVTWGPHLIGYECPECGSDMLTQADYNGSERVMKTMRWINKWFGWLGHDYIPDDPHYESVRIHYHDGKTVVDRSD